jgi:hypothetical protein
VVKNMNKKSDETVSEEQSPSDPAQQGSQNRSQGKQPRYLLVAWILLLALGAFFLFAPLSDLAADANVGLPSDHQAAFQAVAGTVWASAVIIPMVLQMTGTIVWQKTAFQEA